MFDTNSRPDLVLVAYVTSRESECRTCQNVLAKHKRKSTYNVTISRAVGWTQSQRVYVPFFVVNPYLQELFQKCVQYIFIEISTCKKTRSIHNSLPLSVNSLFRFPFRFSRHLTFFKFFYSLFQQGRQQIVLSPLSFTLPTNNH